MNFNEMIGFGIALVVFGVVFVVGAVINTNLGQNSAVVNDTTAQAIVSNVGDTYNNTTSLLPILGLVVIAGLIIFGIRGSLGGQSGIA